MVEKMNEALSKEREEQIILAARRVFAHYGFSKTTMEDISSEVEMGKASLYYYFPTKENLFQAAIKHEQDEFIKKADSLFQKHASAGEKLKIYVDERLKFFNELVNLGTLSFNAIHDRHAIFLKMYESFAEQEIGIINKIIKEGKTKGEFISNVPKCYAELLIHLLQGLRLRSIKSITGSEMDPKIYRELRSEMMMTIDMFIKVIQINKKINKE
jgi:TetR/AcrR family transcriptional repressor of mexJK operon